MKKLKTAAIVIAIVIVLGVWATNFSVKHFHRTDGCLHRPPTQPTFTDQVLDSCGIVTNGRGYGSCVAIGPDLLLTAGHCVGINGAWVEVGDVRHKIIEEWVSDTYDVGFLRIDGVLPYIEFGPIPKLLDVVYLVGTPYDSIFVNTITKGIMSHLDRDIWDEKDLIQTDAEGAPGSSGGPLFNISGQIVGICVNGAIPGGGVTVCVSVTDIRAALKEYYAS